MKTTTDIYFAAALLALGAKLEKTVKDDPRHMVFHFSSPMRPAQPQAVGGSSSVDGSMTTINLPFKMEPTLDLEKLEIEWVNRTLQINAYELCEAIKRMKSIVHSH